MNYKIIAFDENEYLTPVSSVPGPTEGAYEEMEQVPYPGSSATGRTSALVARLGLKKPVALAAVAVSASSAGGPPVPMPRQGVPVAPPRKSLIADGAKSDSINWEPCESAFRSADTIEKQWQAIVMFAKTVPNQASSSTISPLALSLFGSAVGSILTDRQELELPDIGLVNVVLQRIGSAAGVSKEKIDTFSILAGKKESFLRVFEAFQHANPVEIVTSFNRLDKDFGNDLEKALKKDEEAAAKAAAKAAKKGSPEKPQKKPSDIPWQIRLYHEIASLFESIKRLSDPAYLVDFNQLLLRLDTLPSLVVLASPKKKGATPESSLILDAVKWIQLRLARELLADPASRGLLTTALLRQHSRQIRATLGNWPLANRLKNPADFKGGAGGSEAISFFERVKAMVNVAAPEGCRLVLDRVTALKIRWVSEAIVAPDSGWNSAADAVVGVVSSWSDRYPVIKFLAGLNALTQLVKIVGDHPNLISPSRRNPNDIEDLNRFFEPVLWAMSVLIAQIINEVQTPATAELRPTLDLLNKWGTGAPSDDDIKVLHSNRQNYFLTIAGPNGLSLAELACEGLGASILTANREALLTEIVASASTPRLPQSVYLSLTRLQLQLLNAWGTYSKGATGKRELYAAMSNLVHQVPGSRVSPIIGGYRNLAPLVLRQVDDALPMNRAQARVHAGLLRMAVMGNEARFVLALTLPRTPYQSIDLYIARLLEEKKLFDAEVSAFHFLTDNAFGPAPVHFLKDPQVCFTIMLEMWNDSPGFSKSLWESPEFWAALKTTLSDSRGIPDNVAKMFRVISGFFWLFLYHDFNSTKDLGRLRAFLNLAEPTFGAAGESLLLRTEYFDSSVQPYPTLVEDAFETMVRSSDILANGLCTCVTDPAAKLDLFKLLTEYLMPTRGGGETVCRGLGKSLGLDPKVIQQVLGSLQPAKPTAMSVAVYGSAGAPTTPAPATVAYEAAYSAIDSIYS